MVVKDKQELNPKTYEYWFTKLLEDNSRTIPILANAYCVLLNQPIPTDKKGLDVLIKRIGAIYRDCRNDPYDVLVGIFDLSRLSDIKNPLNYLSVMVIKRHGGE